MTLNPRFKKCAFGLPANASNAVSDLISEIKRELQSNEIGGETSDVVTAEGVVARNEEVNQAKRRRKFGTSF